MEKSNESKQTEKNANFVEKISTFELQRKKMLPFKLFEFQEQFMIGAFLLILTQLEKTRSLGKVFIKI